MQEELISNNVDIKKHAFVSEVVIEDGETKGVRLKNGDFIQAKSVLSNSNLVSTVLKTAGEENFSEDYIKKAQQGSRSADQRCQH